MPFSLSASMLDACVLAVLLEKPAFRDKLTQEVKNVLQVSESTLYPVLRRLTREGFLSTYDEEHTGRNRRYYQLTDKGREQYAYYVEEWEGFRNRIDQMLIKRGIDNES